jgi:ATP-dependent DNA helicase RecQ
LDEGALDQLLDGYRAKRDDDRAMLERMVFYSQTGHCRWKVLLENFSEAIPFDACAHCDNCARLAASMAASAQPAATVADPAPLPKPATTVFAQGEVVRVARYGTGVVESMEGDAVAVVFAEGSRRVFLAAFVRRTSPKQRRPTRTAGALAA